jgi:hypothetical protein
MPFQKSLARAPALIAAHRACAFKLKIGSTFAKSPNPRNRELKIENREVPDNQSWNVTSNQRDTIWLTTSPSDCEQLI